MKWTTYMTRYLRSILFPGTSKFDRKIEELEEEIKSLKKQNESALQACDDLAACINQIANTLSVIMTSYSSVSPRDPVDEALDEFWKKDSGNGGGYLN